MQEFTIDVIVEPEDKSRPPEMRPLVVNERTINMDLAEALGIKGKGPHVVRVDMTMKPPAKG